MDKQPGQNPKDANKAGEAPSMQTDLPDPNMIYKRNIRTNLADYLLNLSNTIRSAPDSAHEEIFQASMSAANALTRSLVPFSQVTTNVRDGPVQIGQEKSEEKPAQKQPKKTYLIDLTSVFEEPFNNFDDLLEKVNFEGNRLGYRFVKGPVHLKKGYHSIYCVRKPRTQKGTVQEGSEKTCEAYYRFQFTSNIFTLVSSNMIHDHDKELFSDQLTAEMKTDIECMPKRIRISDVVTFLQTKYKVKQGLDYNVVYNEFRRLHPLLGENDLDFFIKYLKRNNSLLFIYPEEAEKARERLIFTTKSMLKNYENFGDILLIDTTYQTNKYKIPLAVFSGIGRDGRNVVFALCLLKEENTESFEWAIKMFLQLHKGKLPELVVTDGDLAINRVT